MANEIVAHNDETLTISTSAVSLDRLTPEQQNELRFIAAKKGIDLASQVATSQVRLQAAGAEVDMTVNALKGVRNAGGRYKISMSSQTATGTISIEAKKGVL